MPTAESREIVSRRELVARDGDHLVGHVLVLAPNDETDSAWTIDRPAVRTAYDSALGMPTVMAAAAIDGNADIGNVTRQTVSAGGIESRKTVWDCR